LKIIFATSSKAKFEMAREMINERKITLVYKNIEFKEPRNIDVIPIVRSKALQAWKKFREPLIVNDFGIFIEALNEFPGTQVNFVLKTIGLKNVLKIMQGCENRNVSFKSAVAFANNNKVKIFCGEYPGILATELRGNNTRGWSDFIRLYIPTGFDKTPAEMNEEELEQYLDNFRKIDPFYKFLKWIEDRR
jgi:XTP/dITP diphosphohydrolase